MANNTLKNIRDFNRFIAVRLNVFNRYALGLQYSLVEGRIIGEIGRNQGCSANEIAEILNMDKSYLSRILSKFEANQLITRTVSELDTRKKYLYLTELGQQLFSELEILSDKQAETMLVGLNEQEKIKLLESMDLVKSLLKKNNHQN